MKKSPRKRSIIVMSLILVILIPVLIFSVEMSKKMNLMRERNLDQKINERISNYFQKLQRIGQNDSLKIGTTSIDEKFLAKKIEEGIEKFLEKQRKAQVNRERDAQKRAKNIRRVSKTRDHIFGNIDAEISLIEYSDFECPFCKRFHKTPKKIVKAYGGKVNWVYRHFPLNFHNPGAQKQAEASECATELGGNESFWKYTDLIYERTKSNGRGFPIENLVPLAEEIGLDKEPFQTCLNSEKYKDLVQEDLREGSQSGASGTPGNILLHNKTGAVVIKSGALPFEAFKIEIDRMLQ